LDWILCEEGDDMKDLYYKARAWLLLRNLEKQEQNLNGDEISFEMCNQANMEDINSDNNIE
jgi:hypothetical protein